MNHPSKGIMRRLATKGKSLPTIMLASVMALSIAFPVQAFGASGKDINIALVNDGDGIRNQLVEVVVGTQEDNGDCAGYFNEGWFEEACTAYLNALPSGERMLTSGQKDSAGAYKPFYLIYSFKAEPAFELSYAGQTLVPGVDYTVAYENQDNITDSAKAIVTGIGDFAGSSRTIDYSIVGYKACGYYIDCEASDSGGEYVKKDEDPYYHWQRKVTWPDMLFTKSFTSTGGGAFGQPIVLNNAKDSYAVIPTILNRFDWDAPFIETSASPHDVHPSVTASDDDAFYVANVSEAERAFNTPVDKAHIWLSDSGKAKYPDQCDWELQAAHAWWNPKEPTNATDDDEGTWSMSDFLRTTSAHSFLQSPTGSTNAIIYKGYEATKNDIEALLDGFETSTAYIGDDSICVYDENGVAVPEDDLGKYIKVTSSGQHDMSAYEALNGSSSVTVKSAEVKLEDDGFMNLIEGMMESGFLTKAPISYEPVTLPGQNLKLSVYNYNLDSDLTGYSAVTDAQLGYLVNTRSIPTASKDAIPHDSVLVVNSGNVVSASSDAVDLTTLSDLKLSGFEGITLNVADEMAFTVTNGSTGIWGIQPVYFYSSTPDGAFEEVSEVKEAGYYKLTLKSLRWKTGAALKHSQGRGYCGEVTSDVFEVKAPVADDASRSALLSAIGVADTSIQDNSTKQVVDDLDKSGNVSEALKQAAIDQLDNGTEYVLASEAAKIDDAVKAARSVYYNADATTDEVTKAKQALDDAVSAYKDSIGKVEVDYSGLQTARAAADAALKSVTKVVKTAADAADLPEGSIWMTEADKADLEALIASAGEILDPDPRTASTSTVMELSLDLNRARTQTIHSTGQASETDIQALQKSLEAAQAKLDDINQRKEAGSLTVCSEADAAKLDKGSVYVLDTALAALGTAIEDAKALVDSYEANPASVTETKAIAATGKLDGSVSDCADTVAVAKDISAAGAARIAGIEASYSPAEGEKVTISPSVSYGESTLAAKTDYTATLKVAGDNSPIAPSSENGSYSWTIDKDGKYTLLVTGVGNYFGSIQAEFSVAYPKMEEPDQPTPPGDESGLTLQSDVEGSNVYITAKVDGKVVPALAAVSVNKDVAEAAPQSDGRIKVTCVGPGLAEIQVQVSDTQSETFYFTSNLAPEGEDAPETKTVTDADTGVKMSGILAEHADHDDWELVVSESTSKMSNVSTSVAGQKSHGIYDVSMRYKGKEMQPLGNITLSFPADDAVIADGFKAVAYHWHNDATEAKCYAADLVTADDGKKYIEVAVSQLSSFEPAVVTASTGTDNPGTTGPGDGAGSKTITSSDIMGMSRYYLYTGSPISVEFWVTVGGKTLTAGTDYTYFVTDSNGVETGSVVNPGYYTLHVQGAGEYSGQVGKMFQVVTDDGLVSDPTRNPNGNLGSGLSDDAGTKAGQLSQTGDGLLYPIFGLLVVAGITAGVLVRLRRGDRVRRAYR